MTDDWSARFSSAEATLTKVLSNAPNHALAHMLLGLVQVFTKRGAQGIAQCEHALALDRNLASANAVIGTAKLFLGRGAETEPHINEAFRLSPRDTAAHRWMASDGIAKASLVKNEAEALERARFVHEKFESDALIEEYIVGRELTLGVLGNSRLTVLPPRETFFGGLGINWAGAPR